MSMEKTIIYLKAEQSSYVDHETIHIGDIASVYCGDKKKEEKIRNIILYEFDENKEKRRTDFSFDFVSNRKNIRADSMW